MPQVALIGLIGLAGRAIAVAIKNAKKEQKLRCLRMEVKSMPVPVWMAIIAAGHLIIDALDD